MAIPLQSQHALYANCATGLDVCVWYVLRVYLTSVSITERKLKNRRKRADISWHTGRHTSQSGNVYLIEVTCIRHQSQNIMKLACTQYLGNKNHLGCLIWLMWEQNDVIKAPTFLDAMCICRNNKWVQFVTKKI